MKKLSTPSYGGMLVTGVLALAVFSCTENSIEPNINEGMLALESRDQFDELINFAVNADSAEIADYVKSLDYKPLKVIMEEVELAEEKLLAELEEKYDPDIPRDREYAEITKRYLAKGVLRLDEFGIPELNISFPAYELFLNEDRTVKIGDKIYQFGFEKVKVIEDGDMGIVDNLSEYLNTNIQDGVTVTALERSVQPVNSTLENAKSCISTSGKYRLITYENNLIYSEPASPCNRADFSHWLELRSLKRLFGSWHNHKTTALRVTGSVRISHYKQDQSTGATTFIRYMVNSNNYFYNLPEGHSEKKYFVSNYPLRYGFNNECIQYKIGFDYTNHTGIGKNGATCSL